MGGTRLAKRTPAALLTLLVLLCPLRALLPLRPLRTLLVSLMLTRGTVRPELSIEVLPPALPAAAAAVLSVVMVNINMKVNAMLVLLLFSVLLVLMVLAVLLARMVTLRLITSVNPIVENCLVKVARSVIQGNVLNVQEKNAATTRNISGTRHRRNVQILLKCLVRDVLKVMVKSAQNVLLKHVVVLNSMST